MIKLLLTGGFLGSGKTTAIQQACLVLAASGAKAGVITNDQGLQLVDSALMKGLQLPTREVIEGCFCCNYTQLDTCIRSLEQTDHPDVIFAESVGSCTDMVATVVKPLLRFHDHLKVVLSVFADAQLLKKMAGGKPAFDDEDIQYIYDKQLEEADILVISKTDLYAATELESFRQWVSTRFPDKPVLFQNSLDQADIRRWLHRLDQFEPQKHRASLEMDYAVYGAGEAKLAWLDESLEIEHPGHDAIEACTTLINKLYGRIQEKGYPIGHLKFLMSHEAWQRKVSFTSLREPKLRQTHHPIPLPFVHVLINARVQTTPGQLKQIIDETIQALRLQGCEITSRNASAFQPGFPQPTHRILD